MAIINKGTAFSNGEQLSANKLNSLVDAATFGTDSVDNASTIVNANGAITVRDSGVTAAKLATDAVTTSKIVDANVTKTKIENVADYKVLGNVSGAAAAPAEVAILDEDDMVSDSATALATQQSIKAYVDSNPPIKAHCTFDGATSGTNPPTTGSNVTSVTRTATGRWQVNLTNPSPLSTFVTLASSSPIGGSANVSTGAYALSNSAIQVQLENSNGNATDGTSAISVVAIW